MKKNEYLCLSDFIAPYSSGKKDYVGAFAVTAGCGADDLLLRYKDDGDEYSSLLMKSLLDRLAEAATEWLHAKVRRYYWGMQLMRNYPSRRCLLVSIMVFAPPRWGYPSIPDQTVNFKLHDMLSTADIGISLTGNGVMYPNASVSGFFFCTSLLEIFCNR